MKSVALYGRSGSGKSTIASLLVERGYQHVKTGAACRALCLELFGSESKTVMNQVTDALRAIDPSVWLRAALRDVDDRPIVFDSMRFPQDYTRFKDEGFVLVKVDAHRQVRLARLEQRGQQYEADRDDLHDSEISLDENEFHAVIENSSDTSDLRAAVSALIHDYLDLG